MNQLLHLSNFELGVLLQQRDRKAFQVIYDRFAPALYGEILRLVKTKKLADEVLEKAFLKIWNDCVTLECVKRNLFIWMYSITYKIAKSELEESKQQPSHVHKLVA